MLTPLLTLALAVAASSPGVASLAVCPERPAAGVRVLAELTDLDGQAWWLTVSPAPPAHPACVTRELPVDAARVRWAGTLAPEVAALLGRGLMLQGYDEARGTVSEVVPLEDPPLATPRPGDVEPRQRPDKGGVTPRPGEGGAGPNAAQGLERSMWAWSPALWRETPDALFDRLRRWRSAVVYVTFPVEPRTGEFRSDDRDRFAAFMALAARERVAVWIVDGEPRAVLPFERASLVTRARGYGQLIASLPPNERPVGVQLDIEPYLLQTFGASHAALFDAYARAVAEVRAATAGLRLEAAVPFWACDRPTLAGTFGDALAPHLDSVAVMDYRTDPDQIDRFARAWLAWGVRHRRGVRIGLEAGPLPDEVRHVYRPAGKGEVWRLSLGAQDVLLLLDGPAKPPDGRAFRYSHEVQALASTQTFRGRTDELARLLPWLERTFASWRSFLGLALHEVP